MNVAISKQVTKYFNHTLVTEACTQNAARGHLHQLATNRNTDDGEAHIESQLPPKFPLSI
jgi:hypothetical protein